MQLEAYWKRNGASTDKWAEKTGDALPHWFYEIKKEIKKIQSFAASNVYKSMFLFFLPFISPRGKASVPWNNVNVI